MKSILITGASRGVGRELAVKCAASGKYDKICINCLKNESALAETAQAVEKAGDVRCITSVGNVGDIKYVETLPREFGQIDVLVNNAAISYVGLLIDMKPEEWDNVIKTNKADIFLTSLQSGDRWAPHVKSPTARLKGRSTHLQRLWPKNLVPAIFR